MKKASTQRRFLAFIIDHIIYSLILVIPFNLLVPFENFHSAFPVIMIIAFIAYAFKDIIGGRSIGKRMLGLYVRNYEDLEKIPNLFSLMARNLLIFIWPIEYFVLITDKDGRRIGDKIAKTQVVET